MNRGNGSKYVSPYESFAFENKQLVQYNNQHNNSSELATGILLMHIVMLVTSRLKI